MKPCVSFVVVVIGIGFAAVRLEGVQADDPSPRHSDDIAEFLPAELRGNTRPDLLAEENAREALLAMVGLVQSPTDTRQEYLLSGIAAGDSELPPAEERGWLTDLIRRNQPAMEQLDDVLKHCYVRFAPEDDADSLRVGIRDLQELRRVRTRLLIEAGDYPSVIERVRDDLRLGRLLTAPPADYLMYSIGLRIQESSIAMLEQAARKQNVPPDVLEVFVNLALSAGEHPQALSCVLRTQFDDHVKPQLQRLPPDGDAAAVVGLWLDRIRPGKPLPFENFDIDAEIHKRRQQIEAILAGHPHPYDREQTIRIVVDRFVKALREPYQWDPEWVVGGWSVPDKELACWPEELSLNVMHLASLLLGNEQPVLDSAKLLAARECLREIDNPLGKHLAVEMSAIGATTAHASLMSSCRRKAAGLAVRLFHDSKGRLPGSLEDVVDAGILPEVPRDPFGGEIQYSAERKIVWSVGLNGVNDNGEFQPGDSFALLRKLALPGSPKLPSPPAPAESPADDRVTEIPLPGTSGSR